MIIHVVQPGETIDSIAITYDIPVQYLIKENELTVPTNLAVGQTIVILYPEKTYTVQENDTLESIASTHDITIMELYRNNPYLADREFIYPGETIVIRYKTEKTSRISTNGYVFPYIDINVLKKTLPFLTYLTIYNYQVTNDGDLINIQDEEIIKIAKEYGVAPIMLLSTLVENDNTMDHNILKSQSLQNRLIQNILYVLERKGYYGLTIDSQFIVSDDRQLYVDFIENITTQMNQKGS
jgi:spore germination protein